MVTQSAQSFLDVKTSLDARMQQSIIKYSLKIYISYV